MKFGICLPKEHCDLAVSAGFDFIELPLGGTLNPGDASDDTERAVMRSLSVLSLPVAAFNVFIGSDHPFVGPLVDDADLKSYVEVGIRRASRVGATTVGIGSAGARRIPEGFSRSLALQQIRNFFALVADSAERNNVTATIEFLRPVESNVLNSCVEAAQIIRQVGSKRLGLLADTWHLDYDEPEYSELITQIDIVKHVHVASPCDRTVPMRGDLEFLKNYFKVLRRGNYGGFISVEGSTEGLLSQLSETRAVLEDAWTLSAGQIAI